MYKSVFIILALLFWACSDKNEVSLNPATEECKDIEVIYTSNNLQGHIVFAECNPGGGTICTCSANDVSIAARENHGEVTSNVRQTNTYVNAIGYKKFTDTFPDNQKISLCTFKYSGKVRLPVLPFANADQQLNPQSVHMMIQFWDGGDALFQSNMNTLEGAIYWEINPWITPTGKIKVYTNGDPLDLIETGIILPPDTLWHNFELIVDLSGRNYVSITIDGMTKDLRSIELARVPHPDWGNDLSLAITTESLATWPQNNCSSISTWTTHFKDLTFQYF